MKRITFFIQMLTIMFMCSIHTTAQYTWTKNPDPVLTSGPVGSWNRHMFEANVLYNPDSSRFEMWFGASVGSYICAIGYASSTDGITWNIHPVPVLSASPGRWDDYTVEFPVVLRENGKYKMWYSSGGERFSQYKTGYATSPDGINWTKDTLNSPVFGPGTEDWEAGAVFFNTILPYNGGYKLWYSGLTSSLDSGKTCIGQATSPDGITWFRDTVNNPVLETGNEGEWDDAWVYCPQVVKIDSTYFMYYTGAENRSFFSGKLKVGLATSPDGISWEKYSENPVIGNSDLGWDLTVETGGIFKKDDTLYMYFDAWGNAWGPLWQTGLARTPIITSVEEKYSEAVPSGYLLSQNYPNPFNPVTVIKYEVPISSLISIKVYDILGNEIETLMNQEKAAGTYELTWNADNLPSGIYIYKMHTENYNEIKKMVLIK